MQHFKCLQFTNCNVFQAKQNRISAPVPSILGQTKTVDNVNDFDSSDTNFCLVLLFEEPSVGTTFTASTPQFAVSRPNARAGKPVVDNWTLASVLIGMS